MFCPECGKSLPQIYRSGDVIDYVCISCQNMWEWNPFQIDHVGYIKFEMDDDTELLVNLTDAEKEQWKKNLTQILQGK